VWEVQFAMISARSQLLMLFTFDAVILLPRELEASCDVLEIIAYTLSTLDHVDAAILLPRELRTSSDVETQKRLLLTPCPLLMQ
jgi:hypothetical protein